MVFPFQLGRKLYSEVVGEIELAITRLMTSHGQKVGTRQVTRWARQIYMDTSRSYRFVQVEVS